MIILLNCLTTGNVFLQITGSAQSQNHTFRNPFEARNTTNLNVFYST